MELVPRGAVEMLHAAVAKKLPLFASTGTWMNKWKPPCVL